MSTINLAALRSPFSSDQVCWRIGVTNNDKTKGMALAYIDARAVMDRLDEVCGPERWQRRYSHAAAKTICEIGIKIGEEWVFKADGSGDTGQEAEKGALSAAFKRAAVCWGIGRYLYDLKSPWVEIEPRGKSFVIKPTELARLSKMIETMSGPAEKTINAGDWDTPFLREWCRSQFLEIKAPDQAAIWWHAKSTVETFDQRKATYRDVDAAKKELGQHRRKLLEDQISPTAARHGGRANGAEAH